MEQTNETIEKEDFSMYETWRTYPPVPNVQVIHQSDEKDIDCNVSISNDLSNSKD